MALTFSAGENTEITSIWETDSNEVATQISAHCPREVGLAVMDGLEDLVPGEVDSTESMGELPGVNKPLLTLATAQ